MVKKEESKNPAPRRSIRKNNSNNGGKKAAIVTPPKKLVRFVLCLTQFEFFRRQSPVQFYIDMNTS